MSALNPVLDEAVKSACDNDQDRQGFKSLANSESPLKRTTNSASASNSRIHPTLSISTGIDSRADVVGTDNPSSTASSLADAKIQRDMLRKLNLADS